MKKIYINGFNLIAPGLSEVGQISDILRNNQAWQAAEMPNMTPDMLPANERRRTTNTIKLALKTAKSLLQQNDVSHTQLVFASSDGDMSITNNLCQTLATTAKNLSPTQFHNSVHNAPASYLTIAKSIIAPSVSIGAGLATFACGLLEAWTQALVDNSPVLLVGYDFVAPQPLLSVRKLHYPIGIGLSLDNTKLGDCLGCITLKIVRDNTISTCVNSTLEPLRMGNPIGFGLPLLEALLAPKNTNTQIYLPYLSGQQLLVEVNYD